MANITLTIPDEHVPTVRMCFGQIMNLGRDATVAECKELIIHLGIQIPVKAQLAKNRDATLAPISDLPVT